MRREHWIVAALGVAFVGVLVLLVVSAAPPQTWLVALGLFAIGFYRAFQLIR